MLQKVQHKDKLIGLIFRPWRGRGHRSDGGAANADSAWELGPWLLPSVYYLTCPLKTLSEISNAAIYLLVFNLGVVAGKRESVWTGYTSLWHGTLIPGNIQAFTM